jgi:hypothetical protein
MPYGNWIDPNGSEMPGPRLRRMGVPAETISLARTLEQRAEASHVSVDEFVQGVATKPESFIQADAVKRAACLRLDDADQLAMADKLRTGGLKDDATVRQVIATLALHGAAAFGLASLPPTPYAWNGPVNMW